MEKKTFYLTCERTWVYDTLIFAAGILGSYTYMLCGGIFCNAQTGNIVLLGIALGTQSWLKRCTMSSRSPPTHSARSFPSLSPTM